MTRRLIALPGCRFRDAGGADGGRHCFYPSAFWPLSRAGAAWRLGWCAAGIAGSGDLAVTPVASLSMLRLGLTPGVNALGALVVLVVGNMLALALWLLGGRQT